jgi:hypothetical protein
LRNLTWIGKNNETMKKAMAHDFAIIWEKDHDERIIPAILRMYTNNLFGAAMIVGVRRGVLTYLIDNALLQQIDEQQITVFKNALTEQCQPHTGDKWSVEVASIQDPRTSQIIMDTPEKVRVYLENIHNLWNLGIKPIG